MPRGKRFFFQGRRIKQLNGTKLENVDELNEAKENELIFFDLWDHFAN